MPLPRPILAALAVAFAASLLLFTAAWVSVTRPDAAPKVELGFDNDYDPVDQTQFVRAVRPGSPAERAGLRAGDHIVSIDGIRIADSGHETRVWMQHSPGDSIHLAVRRPGAASPIFLTGVFRARPPATAGDQIERQISLWFPWPFLIVGLSVLFLRLENPDAWLLALLFGGVAVSPGLPDLAQRPPWWPFAVAYQGVALGMIGPVFYWFYSRFPARSVDRRWPRLKWALLALGVVLAIGGLRDGHVRLPWPVTIWLGDGVSQRAGALLIVACLALGLASFAANFFQTRDTETCCKFRLMFWATVISLGPNLVRLLIVNLTGRQFPRWINVLLSAGMVLMPAAFAYAVLVHRVLEIPVLLRRSARYLLVQRGFTFLLSLLSIGLTLVFALAIPGRVLASAAIAPPSAIALGAVFGTALLWSGMQVHRRISGKIDRAFFRAAYDARNILEDLAEKTRAATGRANLATLLQLHLTAALHPSFVAVRFDGDGPLQQNPEHVAPIPGRDGAEMGRIALGRRLSDEPYSGEDRRLLASVASQAATALDNIRLAEEIAARIDRERGAAREMEIAREVQARLLPQSPPRLDTLECAARCVQARAVGGDYYDFLDLGPHSAGLVLADVSGKGVHAALLVAHLQACLRTQISIAPADPVRLLADVNRMLYRSTAAQHFATLFFAVYDDTTRELLYVNCGHNAPVWLRAGGAVERLDATATVIGAFDRWTGASARVRLGPGDLLVLFSDGISEAAAGDEQFGDTRLIAELARQNGAPPASICDSVLARVQEFSQGDQSDDLTLLVARAR